MIKKLCFLRWFCWLLLIITTSTNAQNALNFDGNSDYIVTTYPGIAGAAPRTVEAWVKPIAGGENVVADWGSDATNGYRFTVRLETSGTTSRVRVENKGSFLIDDVNGGTNLADGNWHHIAVTFDNSLPTSEKCKIFVDGVLKKEGNLANVNTTFAVNLQIGKRVVLSSGYFNGSIDEVRIWDVARTQAEIVAFMNTEFCAFPASLKAYFKMNQGVAGADNTAITSLTDSVSGNNGTFTTFALSGATSNFVAGPAALSVASLPNSNVTLTGTTLSVNTIPGASYQWVDCNNGNLPITGATLPSYTPTFSGNFAVVISAPGNCTATSACTPVIVTGCNINPTLSVTPTTVTANTIAGATYQWIDCNNANTPVLGANGVSFTPSVSGNYSVIIATPDGCSVTTACTYICALSTTVALNGTTLTATTAGAAASATVNYQWIDCNNANAAISGATAATYTPTIDGNYAVIVTTSDGCSATSACTQVVLPLLPNALIFDGSGDYVQTTYPGIGTSGDRTVEAWIKVPSTNTAIRTIVDWGSSTTSTTSVNKFALLVTAANKLQFATSATSSNNNIVGATTIADNNWHHVAVTFDNSLATDKIKLYIDGVQETSGNPTIAVNTGSTTKLRIGYGVNSSGYFNGAIDEVRIWDVVRTQAEISGAKDTELCTIPSSLKAYYKFNKGAPGALNTGQTVAPDSAGTNDGTLNGFALNGTASNWVNGAALTGAPTATVTLAGTTLTVNATAGATYQWVDCANGNAPVSGATTVNFTPVANGNYAVIVTGSNGCSATSACTQVVACNVDDTVTLLGTTLTATQTGAAYQWVNCADDTNISGATNATFTPTVTGNYKVVITMPNSCTITSACTQVVVCNVAASVTLSGTTLTANAIANASYQWVDCNNGNAAITGATSQTFTPVLTGNYAVIITDEYNCTATSSCTAVTITVCNLNNGVTLNAGTLTATQTGANYQWVDCANDTNIAGATETSFTPTVAGSYKVVITAGTCNITSACTSVTPCSVNTSVTVSGTTLSASQTGAAYQWINCADDTNIDGATNATYTPTVTGSYKVVITMPNNCTATSACTQVCVVDNAVALVGTTLTAAQAGGTYQWVDCATNTNVTGATAQSYTPLASGNFKVIITMPNSCTVTSACTQVCVVNNAVTLAGTTLTATQTGATYQWVDCAGNTNISGATAQTYTPSVTGNYKVIITMPDGCTVTSACTQVCVMNNAVTLVGTTLTATQAGATYQWVNCATNANISGATAQSYTPTVTGDYKVIITMGTCTITSACMQVCIINPSVTQTGITLTAVQTGATYQWINCANGNAPVAGATAATFVATATGSYAVIITMPNGCTATSACTPITICNVNQAVTVNGNTITATQTGATYQWVDCTTNMNIAGETSQSFTPTVSGSYKVVISMAGGCSATSVCTSICMIDPAVTLEGTTLTATQAGATYQWVDCTNNTNIAGATAQTYTPLVSGNYKVIVTMGAGCTATSACTTVTVCNLSDEVTLNGTTFTATQAGATYQWVNCDTDMPVSGENSQSFTATTSGNYKVIISTPDNCTTTSACQFVNVCNVTAGVNNNSGILMVVAVPGASYQWINCDNGNMPIAGATGMTYQPTMSGNYALMVTVGECSDTSDCQYVLVCNLNAEVTFDGTTLTVAQADASYQWMNCDTDLPVIGANEQSFTPTVSGNYKVIISTPDNCTITSDCQQVCIIDATVLNNGWTLTAAQQNATYQWINCEDNSIIEGETSATYLPTVTGSYAVQISLSNGCMVTSACEEIEVLSNGSFDFGHAITAYPNPTADRLTVDLGDSYDNVNMTIINIAGQVVATQGVNNSQTFTVDLSSVARGVYFLNIQTASGHSAVLKVLKK